MFAAIFALVTCKSPMCAVSIDPSTKCSESIASSAIFAPVTASVFNLTVVIDEFTIWSEPTVVFAN